MSLKILIDMNLSPVWVNYFGVAGYEAQHWSTLGKVNAPDSLIMAYAREHGYFVLTNDLDFGALLAQTQASGPSVILIRAQVLVPQAIGEKIIAVIRKFETVLLSGVLIVVSDNKHKVRVLPIGPAAREN